MAGKSSNRLRDKKEKILSLWEKRCLSEVASAGTTTKLTLRNSLPLYLDHLSEALAANKKVDFRSVFARDMEAARIGKLHGADRASTRSYELSEVIFEYHILREVIFQELEPEGDLAGVQRDIILDSIEQAVNDAAVEFSEIHTDIQQKFVNMLTHDLKTPIAAAKMNAQLILRRGDSTPATVSAAGRIEESLTRLTSMIHDLLDASRIRAGEEMALQFVECDLNAILKQVTDEMSVVFGDRFKFEPAGEAIGFWGCDGIRRCVENLIGNAVKYGTAGSPITLSLSIAGKLAKITVHNLGSAIPAQEVPLLFQQHRRSKAAQDGPKTGWGLGLTLVKGVVDAHGGTVKVESDEKSGTRFILEIPEAARCADAENAELGMPPERISEATP